MTFVWSFATFTMQRFHLSILDCSSFVHMDESHGISQSRLSRSISVLDDQPILNASIRLGRQGICQQNGAIGVCQASPVAARVLVDR